MDDLKKIQEICIEIMKDIDKVCRENNIKYSLCGGSVIGAKLYGGFIPWDDDIDLMMDRYNYNKFIKIYRKQHNDKYELINYHNLELKNIRALFSRVISKNDKTIETINGQTEIEGNVFIDITVFDGVKNKFDFKIKEIRRNLLFLTYYKLHNILPGTKWKKNILRIINPFINTKKFKKKITKYEKKCQKDSLKDTYYCSELMGTIFPGRLYEKSLFDEYININFENMELMIVKDYDEYLFQRYGRREFTKENKTDIHYHIRLKK